MDLNKKIELKDIDFTKVKAFLKRKENLILLGAIIFIVIIISIGNVLIEDYKEAAQKRELAKKSYERIINSDTDVNSLTEKIEKANAESEEIFNKIAPVDRKDVADFLVHIENDTGVSWKDRTLTVKNEIKDVPGIKGILVNISEFDATYGELKIFVDYMKHYWREVSIDSLNFNKDALTGRMKGNMSLMFYMEDSEATQEEE